MNITSLGITSNVYVNRGGNTVVIILNGDSYVTHTAEYDGAVCPAGRRTSKLCSNVAVLVKIGYGYSNSARNNSHIVVYKVKEVAELIYSSANGRNVVGSFFVILVCVCGIGDAFKLNDRVCLFSTENCYTAKYVLCLVVVNRNMLYAPTVAGEELLEGKVNDLLVFLKVNLSVAILVNAILVSCIGMKMLLKLTVCILNDVITGLFTVFVYKKEVARLSPGVTSLDFGKALNLGES